MTETVKSFWKCSTCKFLVQGMGSAKCFNPKQKNEALKEYTNPHNTCELHEKGNPLDEKELTEMGYSKYRRKIKDATGNDIGYYYYSKKQNT